MAIKDDKTHIDLVEHLAEGVSIIREEPGERKEAEPGEPLAANNQTAAAEAADTEK